MREGGRARGSSGRSVAGAGSGRVAEGGGRHVSRAAWWRVERRDRLEQRRQTLVSAVAAARGRATATTCRENLDRHMRLPRHLCSSTSNEHALPTLCFISPLRPRPPSRQDGRQHIALPRVVRRIPRQPMAPDTCRDNFGRSRVPRSPALPVPKGDGGGARAGEGACVFASRAAVASSSDCTVTSPLTASFAP